MLVSQLPPLTPWPAALLAPWPPRPLASWPPGALGPLTHLVHSIGVHFRFFGRGQRNTPSAPAFVERLASKQTITGRPHGAAAQDFHHMSKKCFDINAKFADVKFPVAYQVRRGSCPPSSRNLSVRRQSRSCNCARCIVLVKYSIRDKLFDSG